MCGLIGVVTSDIPGDEPLDLAEMVSVFARLEEGEPAPTRLDEASDWVDALFGFPNFYQALRDDDWRDAISVAGRVLSRCAARLEQQRDEAGGVAEQERLASAANRCRDLAWRLEEDLLPNLDKVRGLVDRSAGLTRSHAFVLWQLNTLLNGIDRLEVRGRDSAGVAVHVYFPGPEVLSRFCADATRARGLAGREALADFVSGAVRRVVSGAGRSASPDCLLFVYKVASEVGEMGENVAALRAQIRGDRLFHDALNVAGVRTQALAHTRWASNGIVSEANCHPLDNGREGPDGSSVVPSVSVISVLNGDIDNYQSVKKELAREGWRIPAAITTDAKVISLRIERNVARGMSFEEAFRHAVTSFDGSMAIAVQSSLCPGKTFLALRGSGQSIYIGVTPRGYVFASELYGVVEETQRFIKMDGEKERCPGDAGTTGQIAVLDAGWEDGTVPGVSLTYYDGTPLPPSEREERKTEITTRDINRGGHRHFMLKEINESVESVRKTIAGKYRIEGNEVRFHFLEEIMPGDLLRRLEAGIIQRILCVGQGTAAVAAQGIAELMQEVFRGPRIEVSATKATELSGFLLRPSMEDTLVVAVSQSGTTTDTNRTVDVVKDRGAAVLAIVNRRNSDLAFKADAVFYTSDGRDVEMSVASTKAFYAQVAAGYLLALALARHLGLADPDRVKQDLQTLERLPAQIAQVVANPGPIETLARRFAVRKRYWAVVGNGTGRVAANEIRIKLSELCYKAIAFDVTEDKKHIDLSSEPLIIVCAVGLSPSNLRDVVKEVAIFKAHKACPLVIAEEGESRFEPYAAGVMYVPRDAGRLGFVLATVAGHLWGYHAALALDAQAADLRQLRARSVALFEQLSDRSGMVSRDALANALRAEMGKDMIDLETRLMAGELDSGLTAATAIRLLTMMHAVTGRIPLDDLVPYLGGTGPMGGTQIFDAYLEALTTAINDLSRPIDAIKHQAKTVTVGITRAEQPTGVLFEALERAGVSPADLLPSHVEVLEALSPLVAQVLGAVRYRIGGLTDAGEPGRGTWISVEEKTGIAKEIPSRAVGGAPLMGTKWLATTQRWVFAGRGSSDGRPIVLFPLLDNARLSGILLFHVRFRHDASATERARALRAYRNRYEWIVGSVTELNIPWDDRLLERIPVDLLFEGAADLIARHIMGEAK